MDSNTSPEKKVSAGPFGGYGIVIICTLVLLVCLAPFVISLLGQQPADDQTQNDKTAQTRFDVDKFPYLLELGGKTASIDSIDFLELYGNHGYTGYLLISIDRGNLSDDDIYWMTKGYRFEWELNAHAYWWPEGAAGDSASIDFFAIRQSKTHIYFIFRSDLQRYSFKDTHISAQITYLPDGVSISDQHWYFYSFDFSGEDYHDSTDFLPSDALIALADAMVDAVS